MEELKRLRTARGWSQQKLADESGVNKATINQVEQGKRSPSITTLQSLARAMGAEVGDFFPKAQAPLWSDEAPERRYPAFNFKDARESFEHYCARWEKLIADGKLDDSALDEFLATAEGWLPMLGIALGAEIRTRGLVEGDTQIGKVNRRYLRIFSKVIDIMMDRIGAAPGEPPAAIQNVVYLQEVHDRMLKRAVG